MGSTSQTRSPLQTRARVFRTPRFIGRPPRRAALRIALIYVLFGALWIVFSDEVVELFLSPSTIHRYHIQTLKGWLFIAVTAGALYFLIRRTVTAFRVSDRARLEVEERSRLLVERVRDYAIFTLDAD